MSNVLSISPFLIISSKIYVSRRANPEACFYVIFPTILLLHPSTSPYSSHSSLFGKPIYIPQRSASTIIFDTHKKITSKLIIRYVLICKLLYIRRGSKRFIKVRWKNSPSLITFNYFISSCLSRN